jgi:hypothetical protein
VCESHGLELGHVLRWTHQVDANASGLVSHVKGFGSIALVNVKPLKDFYLSLLQIFSK